MRTTRNPGGKTRRNATHDWRWEDAGGLVAPIVALALWVAVVVAVAAPLGSALARIDARRARPASAIAERVSCSTPPGALASTARPPRDAACR